MTPTSLDRTVRKAFTALCWNVGTPVAYRALKALERSDWRDLTSMKVNVQHYVCARTLSGDLQIASFFKKYPDFDLGIDLKQRAELGFYEGERSCYYANERLSPFTFDPDHHGRKIGGIIRRVKRQVAYVLGRCPDLSELNPRFGPGSTFQDVGPLITVPDKMSDDYTLTLAARPLLRYWDETAWSRYAATNLTMVTSPLELFQWISETSSKSPLYATRESVLVSGNRFTSVPKDAWKNRGICIEPSVNLFYQLGVGEWLTMRMGKVLGWRKDSQSQHHKLLAQLGSLTRENATIDLSNASDTICRTLVKLLLPDDWFNLLEMLRSSRTLIGGRWVRLEKFSSMGNGFTFELETLIFDSITRVMCEGVKPSYWQGDVVSVFGDDIICPRERAEDVIAALTFFGFSINESKTFISGDFRESCGGDFFKGMNVRPHYLKESPCEPHQYIALANGLRRFGIRHILCGGPDVYRYPWICILQAIPSTIRSLRGPEHLGDQVIHDDESTWRYTVRSCIRYFRVWRPVPFVRTGWEHFRPGVVLASALYGCGDGRNRTEPTSQLRVIEADGVLSRVDGRYVSGYRFGRVAYS